jgi:hypothetical protein
VNSAGNYPRKNNGSLSPVGADPVFTVAKDFVPNSGASVTVSLSCPGGTASPPTAAATEAAPASFTVSGLSSNASCTAMESPIPDGYTSTGTCTATLLTVGACTIVNTITTAQFVVNKDFVPDSGASVTVGLSCTSGSVANDDTSASEADPANFTVTGFNTGATCTATETVPGGYAPDQTGCASRTITDGSNTTCTIINTEAADSDGDTVADSIDNCRYWPNAGQGLPNWPVGGDDPDCDGFDDVDEATIATDPADQCGFVPEGDQDSDTWPPDMAESDSVDILDVLALKPVFNGASARHDLTVDGVVNILDVLALKPFFNETCTG